MLSIGEFSNICKVSAKTLRYYAEIGLLQPAEVNPENGYRYYSIRQLETMLFINRLKAYNFSLEEIREILEAREGQEAKLYLALSGKQQELERQLKETGSRLEQLNRDLTKLRCGKSMISGFAEIDIRLEEGEDMYLLSRRKMVLEEEFPREYQSCFGELLRKITEKKLTMAAPPMVLFHSAEYTSMGMDTEFAIPVKEYAKGTRDFTPGLCLKTTHRGSYLQLPGVYARQIEYAKREGYECNGALFEVYVTDPSMVADEKDCVTEVYYQVKKTSFSA